MALACVGCAHVRAATLGLAPIAKPTPPPPLPQRLPAPTIPAGGVETAPPRIPLTRPPSAVPTAENILERYTSDLSYRACFRYWFPNEAELVKACLEDPDAPLSKEDMKKFVEEKVQSSLIDLRSFYMARARNLDFFFDICVKMKWANDLEHERAFFHFRARHHNRLLVREAQKVLAWWKLGRFFNLLESTRDNIKYDDGDGPAFVQLYKRHHGDFKEISRSAMRVDESIGAILSKFDFHPYDARTEITAAEEAYWKTQLERIATVGELTPGSVDDLTLERRSLLDVLEVVDKFNHNLQYFTDLSMDMIRIATVEIRTEWLLLGINTLDLLLRTLDPTVFVSMAVAPLVKATLSIAVKRLVYSQALALAPQMLTAAGRARLNTLSEIETATGAGTAVTTGVIQTTVLAPDSSAASKLAFSGLRMCASNTLNVAELAANNMGIIFDLAQIVNNFHNLLRSYWTRWVYQQFLEKYSAISQVNAANRNILLLALSELEVNIQRKRAALREVENDELDRRLRIEEEEMVDFMFIRKAFEVARLEYVCKERIRQQERLRQGTEGKASAKRVAAAVKAARVRDASDIRALAGLAARRRPVPRPAPQPRPPLRQAAVAIETPPPTRTTGKRSSRPSTSFYY